MKSRISNSWYGSDIISMKDFCRADINVVNDLALRIQKERKDRKAFYRKQLQGKVVGSLFLEDSTRTRISHRQAAYMVGADWQDGIYGSEGSSVKKGESTKDCWRVFTGYDHEVTVMRHPLEGAARWAAEVSSKAVVNDRAHGIIRERMSIVNGGDGANQHPTQVFVDLFTILNALGGIDKLNIGLVGDIKHSRVANSWFSIAAEIDAKLHLGYPQGFEPSQDVLDYLKNDQGVEYATYHNIVDVLSNVDVAIILRPQLERMRPDEQAMFKGEWVVSRKLLEKNSKTIDLDKLVLMHPLPRNKNSLEITKDVDDMKCAWYFQQESFGPSVRAALFSLIAGSIGKRFSRIVQPSIEEYSGTFVQKEFDSSQKDRKSYKVGRIDGNGVVIDRLPEGTAKKLVQLLEITDVPEYTGSRLHSGKLGKKDLVKYDGLLELDEERLSIISLLAPEATINYIRDGKLQSKFRYELGRMIGNIAQCSNPSCITRPEHNEHTPSRFYVEDKNNHVLRCYYCDKLTKPTEQNPLVIKKAS